jgi:hypothetical protein
VPKLRRRNNPKIIILFANICNRRVKIEIEAEPKAEVKVKFQAKKIELKSRR